MRSLHPLTLSFRDPAQESRYREATRGRTRQQVRAAILVGILVYLLGGILDVWFASPEATATNWTIRLTSLSVPVLVLILIVAVTDWFDRHAQPLLALMCIAAGVGIIGIQGQVAVANSPYYYPMLILLTFYTYNFIGVRFIHALFVDVLLLVSYNVYFGAVQDYPLPVLLAHDIFIVSANLIGGTAGYMAERHKRIIYLTGQQLEAERNFHFNRSIHDPMTGLPNRELLYDRIQQAMARSQRDGSRHCGLFVDLDGFKAINDHFGHDVGDQVLNQVAARLSDAVREADTVARIGGDEFFVLAQDVESGVAVEALAEKLLTAVNEPLPPEVDGFRLTASIGICEFPFPGMTVRSIIRRADNAMYEVKKSGKSDFEFAGQAALPD